MFERFPTEELKLIKKDGQKTYDFIGLVSADSIRTEDTTLPIEVGDVIERPLPDGNTDKHIVTKRLYIKGNDAYISDTFKILFGDQASSNVQSNSPYINITSEGNRVYIDSTDNSINIEVSETDELFNQLREVIKQLENSDELIKVVTELQNSLGKESSYKNYANFIQVASNHMALIAPFLPAITTLLTKAS